MSTGGSASGAYLLRTANLPVCTAFTALGRCHYRAGGATSFWNVIAMESATVNASGGYGLCFRPSDDNLFLLTSVSYPTTYSFTKAPRPGEWFLWAVVGRGTGANDLLAYWSYPEDLSLKHVVSMPNINIGAFQAMFLGNNSYSDWGSFANEHVKVFDAVLTQEEIFAEWRTPGILRLSDLNLYTPLHTSADLLDRSGNGRSWTSNGTITDYAGLVLNPVLATRRRWLSITIPGGGTTTLLLAGARSDEMPGASLLAAIAALSSARGDEAAGAAVAAGALAPSSALLYDAYGAPVLAGTAAPATAAPDEAAGAAQAAGSLALASALSGESAGAPTLAQLLVLAAGLPEDRYGAAVAAGLSLLSGAETADMAGSAAVLGAISLAGTDSEERAGALTILQTMVLLLASAADDAAVGAPTVAGSLAPASAPSAEAQGAAVVAALLTLAAALSAEAAGAPEVTSNLTTISAGAGAPSEERMGATGLAMVGQLATALGEDRVGEILLAATVSPPSALSAEVAGAPTITMTVTVVVNCAPSEEAFGAPTVIGTAELHGAAADDLVGALQMQGLIGALPPALSGERPGAVRVFIAVARLVRILGEDHPRVHLEPGTTIELSATSVRIKWPTGT